MKLIPLTQGKFAKVDNEDFEWLSKYKWALYARPVNDVYYAKRSVSINRKTVTVRMHREIMRVLKGFDVDHINHDGLDNRKKNLRICTKEENLRNRRRQRNQSNKYIGVYKQCQRWGARIWTNGKQIYIGTFDTEAEAVKARDSMALKLRGQFAKLNFQTASKPE